MFALHFCDARVTFRGIKKRDVVGETHEEPGIGMTWSPSDPTQAMLN
jgi:hypothetical protein